MYLFNFPPLCLVIFNKFNQVLGKQFTLRKEWGKSYLITAEVSENSHSPVF